MNGLKDEFNVPNIPARGPGTTDQEYRRLSGPLASALVRIQARKGSNFDDVNGVQLGYKTKAWLRQEISQLMNFVQDSDLPTWKKESLLAKLRQLMNEVDARRFNYAAVMSVLVPLAALSAGGSTTIVNAPKIATGVHHIIDRLGAAYAEEEAEHERISGPPLAITDQSDATE